MQFSNNINILMIFSLVKKNANSLLAFFLEIVWSIEGKIYNNMFLECQTNTYAGVNFWISYTIFKIM